MPLHPSSKALIHLNWSRMRLVMSMIPNLTLTTPRNSTSWRVMRAICRKCSNHCMMRKQRRCRAAFQNATTKSWIIMKMMCCRSQMSLKKLVMSNHCHKTTRLTILRSKTGTLSITIWCLWLTSLQRPSWSWRKRRQRKLVLRSRLRHGRSGVRRTTTGPSLVCTKTSHRLRTNPNSKWMLTLRARRSWWWSRTCGRRRRWAASANWTRNCWLSWISSSQITLSTTVARSATFKWSTSEGKSALEFILYSISNQNFQLN